MKKQIALLIAILLIATMCFVACNGSGNEQTTSNTDSNSESESAGGEAHSHTYGDVWSMDETNHWHAAVCTDGSDCTAVKASVKAHADADNDKICDVCGYDYGHTHTFSEEWTADEQGHRHSVSCGCSIDSADAAEHIDTNKDGACDTCEYVVCEHEFDTDGYAADEKSHWYAATCGCAVKQDEEAHDFNDVNICETCGYIKGSIDVSTAIALGEYYDSLVNGGKIVFVQDAWSYQEIVVDYKLGTGCAEYNMYDSMGNRLNQYCSLVNGSMYVIGEMYEPDKDEPEIAPIYDLESAIIDGYCFDSIFSFNTSDDQKYYGATELVTALYAMAKENGTLEEYIIMYEGAPVYIFTFESGIYEGQDAEWNVIPINYEIKVEFTLGEGYNFENVVVTSSSYELQADIAEEGSTAAEPTYHRAGIIPLEVISYKIEQTAGARSLTPKYTGAELATSFEVLDLDGNKLGNTITVTAGAYCGLQLRLTAPEGAGFELDQVIAQCEGIDIWVTHATGELGFVAPLVPGTYTLSVKTTNSEAQIFTVVVEPKPVESLTPNAEVDGQYSEHYYLDLFLSGGDVSVNVMAVPDISGDHPYTVALAEQTANAAIVDNLDGTYTFKATAIGDYTVVFTLTENPEIEARLQISVMSLELSNVGLADKIFNLSGAEIQDTSIDVSLAFGSDSVTVTNNTAEPNTDYYPLQGMVSGTYQVSVSEDGKVYFADAAATEYVVYKEWTGDFYIQIVGVRPPYTLSEVDNGSAGDNGDIAAALDGRVFESDLRDSYGAYPQYIIDFSYMEILEDPAIGWIKFDYEIQGNQLIFTSEASIVSEATFVYEEGNIVATLADGTVITFYKV